MKSLLGATALRFLLSTVLLAIFPAISFAAQLKITSDTLVRGYERDKSTQTNILVAPAYEYLQVDYGALNDAGFSFHGQGWGRSDLGDRDFFTDNEDGELLYGYIEYSMDKMALSTRLGRQYIFAGPAAESIDGLRVQGEYDPFSLSFSAFAGLPVALDDANGSGGDFTYGASLGYTWKSFDRATLSYKYVDNDSLRVEEKLGFDLFMILPHGVDLTGQTSWNMITDDCAERLLQAQFRQYGVDFRPFVQRFQYEDYFADNANSGNPFRYLAGTGESLNIFGTDATKSTDSGWDYGGKFKYYDYSTNSDTSFYLAGLAVWHGEDMTQAGGELGYMAGDRGQDEYFIYRFFTYWDQLPGGLWPKFVSGDVVFVDYNEAINNEDTSLFVSLGGGYRLLNEALEVKLSGDYSSDPFFDSDLKGMLTITYKYSQGQ